MDLYHCEDYDNEERCKIDFVVRDNQSDAIVATVWGDSIDSVEIDCDHVPDNFPDIEDRNECIICGAECDWHYVKDDGHDTPEVIEWHAPKEIGGVIAKELKRIKETL